MNLYKDNRIVVDLNKVQFARFYYKNQQGITRDTLPKQQTISGREFAEEDKALFHPEYPGETCLQRGARLGLLDTWHPELLLKLQANHCLIYTNKKAISIWKEWNRRMFKKKS